VGCEGRWWLGGGGWWWWAARWWVEDAGCTGGAPL
jgi:hypothetical protein